MVNEVESHNMKRGISRRNIYRKAQRCVSSKKAFLSQERLTQLEKLCMLIWDVPTREGAEEIAENVEIYLKNI